MAEEEAEATSLKYQSLFPEITPLSSRDLLHDTFSHAQSQTSTKTTNNSPEFMELAFRSKKN